MFGEDVMECDFMLWLDQGLFLPISFCSLDYFDPAAGTVAPYSQHFYISVSLTDEITGNFI